MSTSEQKHPAAAETGLRTVPDYEARHPRSGDEPPVSPRRRLWAMLLVCAILLAAAVGLNASVAALKLTFQKKPVPLRQPLAALPAEIGPWVQISIDIRLSAEQEADLRAQDYIQRIYADTRLAEPGVLARWRSADVKTPELREEMFRAVRSKDAMGIMRLHVAYHTGAVDTVPHIPERCMLAGGFDPVGRTQAVLDAGGRNLRTSFVQSEERAGHAQPMTFNVAYFFQVNGDYEHDAITGVRRRLQDLSERYAYFAKVELMTQGPGADAAESQRAMADFLSHALPQIERVLPDWQSFRRGGEE